MIRIGTRKSKLAIWQAEWVAAKLSAAGLKCGLVPMETIGDKILDTSIAKIGSKGVFTEDLEQRMKTGDIQLAVHSAKDLASTLPDGFELLAFGPRENAQDVIVALNSLDLTKPLILGSSGTRRVAQFKRNYPHLNIQPVRGNLQTRLQKLKDGMYDGLILAYAGVHRMGFDAHIQVHLPLREYVTAAGQGIVAVECHADMPHTMKLRIREAVNDPQSESHILAERAFLQTMQGGCSIPVFAHAFPHPSGMELVGGILSLDGSQVVQHQLTGHDPNLMGLELGQWVLDNGGKEILAKIREEL